MDMTLAEQLVWAAVFAAERTKDGEAARREKLAGGAAMYATQASQAVDDMRCAFKSVTNSFSKLHGAMTDTDLNRLRQMVFRVED